MEDGSTSALAHGRRGETRRDFTADDALDLFWKRTESPTCVLCDRWRGALSAIRKMPLEGNGLQLQRATKPRAFR